MDNNKDNTGVAPVIPSGTEPTVYGRLAFTAAQSGQAPQPVPGTVNPPANQGTVPAQSEFQELATKKGWKSPDELARAYTALESHATKVTMDMGELLKARVQEPEATPVQQTQSQQAPNTPDEAIKIVEGIAKKTLRPLEDKIELQDLFINHTDAREYAADMAQIVKQNPSYSWETAYKLAKFPRLEQTSREQGRQEAYTTIGQKVEVTAGASRPTVKDTTDLQAMVSDKSIPLRDITRMMKERLNQ